MCAQNKFKLMDWVETKLSLKFMAGSEDCWRWWWWRRGSSDVDDEVHSLIFKQCFLMDEKQTWFGFFWWLFCSYKIHVAVGYDRWKWKAHEEEARLNKFHVNTHHKHPNGTTKMLKKKKHDGRKKILGNRRINSFKHSGVLTLFHIRNCDAFHKLIHSHSFALFVRSPATWTLLLNPVQVNIGMKWKKNKAIRLYIYAYRIELMTIIE